MTPSEHDDVRVANLDGLDAIEVAGTRWHPIRRALGIDAFAVNAYSAATAGSDVIEDHDELGTGSGAHRELYLVVRGAATFTVGGRPIEAPAGTLVYVPDPATRRQASAAQDDTWVIAIGAPPGAAGAPSPFEFYFASAPAARAGDHAAAAATIAEGLEHHPDNERIHYELACQLALDGRLDEARRHLRRSIELEPGNAQDAMEDDELVSVRDVVTGP